MFTHVVMMKLNDKADAARLCELLNGLNGQIPGMQSMLAGEDVIGSGRSWDMCLVSTFDDRAAMDAYQTHPAHVAVAGEIRAAAAELATVDF